MQHKKQHHSTLKYVLDHKHSGKTQSDSNRDALFLHTHTDADALSFFSSCLSPQEGLHVWSNPSGAKATAQM